MTQIKLFIFISLLLVPLACSNPNNLGKSSQSGEINPLDIASEAISAAQKKNPQSILIGLKSGDTQITQLGLSVSRYINATFKAPTGKADIWDFYFAASPGDFTKDSGGLGKPDTYTLPAEKTFGVRYQNGQYIFLNPEYFNIDAKYLATTQGLKLPVTLAPEKLLPRVQEELSKIYGTDKITSIAYSLQDRGFAWPLTADSWMNQQPKTAPVWEVVAVLEGGEKGGAFLLDATTGELVEQPEQFEITKR